MHIKEITSQHRRDFKATYVCEHCAHEVEEDGYDDDNYHNNVIPEMKCPECGEVAGEDYVPRDPQYPADMVV